MNTLLEIAITATKEAGAEILKHYATTDFETKDDGSPLTIADTRSNEILIAHLEETKIPILSEESGAVPLPYPDRLWIIDPLDGTKDFLKKNGDFCVMIGLLEKGQSILGVIYVPVHDTLYYATKGAGAYMVRDEVTQRLTVANNASEGLRFIRSVNHFRKDMELVAEKLGAILIPRGSIGIKAGFLGEAKGDFFFSWGNFGEWDICAPQILITESGGRVTDCRGEPLSYGTDDHRVEYGTFFSNGACHERVLEVIRTTTKKE